MKKTLLALLPFLFALFCLSGCGTGVKLVSITVNVLELHPKSDTSATMVVRYVNENVTSFAVDSSKHKLYLNGQYVGTARSKEPVGLLQLNHTNQTLALDIEKPDVFRSMLGQTVPYVIESELRLQVGDDEDKLKSRSTGQVEVSAN
ncbi:MAG TPA: hypothetical protein VFT72_18635 [Opitutaceae bacterium]|nr:hypothetical protein [Opitutaceae bacterium]